MTGSLATQLAEAQAKLRGVEGKLDQLEDLKAAEANLRNQVSKLARTIAQLQKDIEDEAASQAFFQKAEEEEDDENHATSSGVSDSKAEGMQEKDPQLDRKNKLRALNKKLQQIDKLKAKGGALDPEAAAKVASEPWLRQMLATLEKGEECKEKGDETQEEVPKKEDTSGQEKPLPTEPTEREKRLRTLRKKLQDIASLKGREGVLDAEALAKIDSEQLYLQEVTALEAGNTVFVFDEAAAMLAKKYEAEKKLKKLNKRLEQIQELKNKGTELDSEALAKVESEQALKKEIHQLQAQIGSINKQERERVARRLGWEQDWADQKAEEKTSKKARSKARSVGAGA